MEELVVGIDLGTTNSLIGTVVDGEVRLLAGPDGTVLLPSIVGSSPGGEILVGRRARNRRLLDPRGTARSVKRQMGKDIRVRVGTEELSPPEVSALILAALLDIAERELGRRPARAVITVPAYFDDNQRQATMDAGEIASLEIARLVNEPTAAALAHQTGTEELVLVYDLGGGTFDVSVLERDEDFMEVRSSHGDTELGGDDIDRELLERVLSTLGRDADVVRADPHAMTRLAEAVERAKISLSSAEEARLHEPFLAGEGAGVVNLDFVMRRDDVDAVAQPLLERTLACIDAAMADARVLPADLDRILLVGGASQMPIVARIICEHLDMPVQLVREPELTVARGAVLLAGRAAGAEVDEVLVDITPFTLAAGTMASGSSFGDDLLASPVIPRGTVIPTKKTATYYTAWHDQPVISLPIAQGDSQSLYENTVLGDLIIEDLPPSPIGSPVDVVFQLDLSGVLHVSATHRPSLSQASTTIKHGPNRLTEQRRESARARIAQLRAGEGERAARSASNEDDGGELRLARSLLRRAERALEAEVASPLRERMEGAVVAVERTLEEGASVGEELEELADVLYELD